MPLPAPASPQAIHTRSITCKAYLRTDGLWDVEGHLVDEKTYGYDSEVRGRVEAGAHVHDMWLRLTVDEGFVLREVEAVMEANPFHNCPDITPNFARLAGVRIGHGWRRKVRELLGGVQGCTHLVEMLGPLATTAFQAIGPHSRQRDGEDPEGASDNAAAKKFIVNSCHGWSAEGPAVRRWAPEFYTGKE